MNKKRTLLAAILLTTINLFSQTSPWQWSRGVTGGLYSEGSDVATDATGNAYVTGNYIGANITYGTITLTNPSNYFNGTLVKYDASGNVIWATSVGGNLDDGIESVCTDTSGNIYVTGYFNSASITIGTYTLTNSFPTFSTLFIAKYTTNGNVVWAKSATSATGENFPFAIATDVSGNVFISGQFNNTITFGTTTLTSAGGYDGFVAKMDASGNDLWAVSAGNLGDESYNHISTDAAGNVFVAANFTSDSVTFGTTTIVNSVLSAFNSYEGCLVKYDASGTLQWVTTMQGTGADYAISTATDATGNIVVAGYFSSDTLTIAGSSTFHSNGITDIFLAKYNTNGNLLWAKSAGGVNDEYGYGLTTYGTDIFFAGGFNNDTLLFGTDSVLYPANSNDAFFLVQFDASGNVICKSTLASGGDDAIGMATDNSGNLYIACDYSTIGAFQVGNDTLAASATEKIFIAKYNCISTSVGITEPKITNTDVTISPNPFTSQTTITFTEEQKNTTIKITDVLGKVIQQLTTNNRQQIIDMSGFAKGIYFVRIEDSTKNVVNRKIVLQ